MSDTPDILKKIVARKRKEVFERAALCPQDQLIEQLATAPLDGIFSGR